MGAGGRFAARRRRWKVAGASPTAAQAALITPRPGARAATASIRTPRRCRSAGPAAKPLFLDVDDRLGAPQLQCETFVVAQQLGVLGRQGIGRRPLGFALDGLQGLIGAGVTLTAPVG